MAEAKALKMIPHCEGATVRYDVDELVRCKDCAYAIYTEEMKPGCVVCTRPFSEMWQVSKPNDWYCADGVRKKGRCSRE